jgi:hypothetical protein
MLHSLTYLINSVYTGKMVTKFKLKAFEPLEKDIQESICRYLDQVKKQKGFTFWRQNNTSIYDSTIGNFRRQAKWSLNGVSDIIVIKKGGGFVGLECKRSSTKQDPEQINFEKMIKDVGGEYYVVRSIEDVQKINL